MQLPTLTEGSARHLRMQPTCRSCGLAPASAAGPNSTSTRLAQHAASEQAAHVQGCACCALCRWLHAATSTPRSTTAAPQHTASPSCISLSYASSQLRPCWRCAHSMASKLVMSLRSVAQLNRSAGRARRQRQQAAPAAARMRAWLRLRARAGTAAAQQAAAQEQLRHKSSCAGPDGCSA